MSETVKPLWFLIGEKWHEDFSTAFIPGILDGAYNAVAHCGRWLNLKKRPEVETRRAAPPVADQCKRCRAAKAKQRKVSK